MKALMVNSLNPTSIVEHKMKDQLYMKHLRQVEKINNREAQKITNDVKSYHSINDLHHKHKAYAYHWHNKEEDALVQQLNIKMKRKMQEIKSYFNHKLSPKDNTQVYSQTSRVANRSSQGQLATKQPTQSNEPQKSNQMAKKEKKNMSLHYRYRKKRQEQIDRQNQKLEKGILSQRSSYFPQIHKNRQSISALGSKKQQKSIQKEQKQQQKQQKQKK